MLALDSRQRERITLLRRDNDQTARRLELVDQELERVRIEKNQLEERLYETKVDVKRLESGLG